MRFKKLMVPLIFIFLVTMMLTLACGKPVQAPVVTGNNDAAQAQIHEDQGNSYREQKQWDEAIVEYTQVIEIHPEFAAAYFNRGTCYYGKGDYDKAIADYSKVIEIDPKYADAYFNRGLAYYYKHDYDKAIADYTRVIALVPKDADAYTTAGLPTMINVTTTRLSPITPGR